MKKYLNLISIVTNLFKKERIRKRIAPTFNLHDSNISKEMLEQALLERKLFKFADSFFFAAHIPDNDNRCTGSRCTNCKGKSVFCYQICRNCGFPFVGPFYNMVPILDWKCLNASERTLLMEEVYLSKRHGRLTFLNVAPIMLNPEAVKSTLETITKTGKDNFKQTHGIDFDILLKRLEELSSIYDTQST